MDFSGIGTAAIAACVLAMLAGGAVKGVLGMGLPLVSMPVMATFVGVPRAMALLVLASLMTSVWQSVAGGLAVPLAKRLWPMLAGMLAGTWLGVKALSSFHGSALYLTLGTIVAVFASILTRRVVFTIAPRAEPWIGPVVGIASGVVGGLSMLFGPIYAMYFSGLKLDKETFVSAVALTNTWGTVALAGALAGFDLLGAAELAASFAALVPAFAGLALGTWLRRRIDEIVFRKTLAAVLFVIALNLIRKGLVA